MITTACNTCSLLLREYRGFDKKAWLKVCETAAAHAQARCGLSFDYYVELFSLAIELQIDQMPMDHRAEAVQIAKEEWGYATSAERQETQDWNAEHGFCTHGIELGCCPVGCGSY